MQSLAFPQRTLTAVSASANQEEIANLSAGVVGEERAVEYLVLRMLAQPEDPH